MQMSAMIGFLLLSSSLWAAKLPPSSPELTAPQLTEFSSSENETFMKTWKDGRKIANDSAEVRFKESDLTPGFIAFRNKWLQVKTGDQLSALLDESYKKYNEYSPDVQYFLAQMHVARNLRGIVWRLRPIFEKGTGFLGNKATHVSAVQFVRNVATGLDMAFPTNQTDALIEFLTQPSTAMSSKDQFGSIEEFQLFLATNHVNSLSESIRRMKAILLANPVAIYKWDNRMIYGTGAFQDDVNRIIGFGTAEITATIGMSYEAIHDSLVFAAYNQNAILKVAASLGTAFGIDAAVPDMGLSGLGLTDEERVRVINNYVKSDNFLKLREYEGNPYGANLMKAAFVARTHSVEKFAEAYEMLQGKPASTVMALNPVLYQDRVQNRLGRGIEITRAAISAKKEVRDPISGETVTLDIPAFYSSPPASLQELMANNFERGSTEKVITSSSGEKMHVRNYFFGRSNSWNNKAWQKYVPSAQGQKPDYMAKAKRVMHYSLGSASVFGAIDLFVR